MQLLPTDFETEAIYKRPQYPPKPVGVAYKLPGKKGMYKAWGHPSGNNARRPEAMEHLKKLYATHVPIFHNAQFDLDVAETHMGIKVRQFHCTQILAFLHNPHEPTYHLKTLAQKYCGIEPDARDELKDWIIANIPQARRQKSQWGAYISMAPAELAGKYAAADVDMTWAVFRMLHKAVMDLGMTEAYQRELAMVPIILSMERAGVDVDVKKLGIELPKLAKTLSELDKKIRRRLKAPGLEIDKKGDLAAAMDRAGVITDWPLTKKGGELLAAGLLAESERDNYRSTSHKQLKQVITDQFLYHLLIVRGKIATSLRNFGSTWLESGESNNGKVYIGWSCTRKDQDSGGAGGARTGRQSSSPNLQNVPGNPQLSLWQPNEFDTPDQIKLKKFCLGLYSLVPNMRSFIVPGGGKAFGVADYQQQELRILAHYEDGPLLKAYRENPRLDVHSYVAELIYQITGIDLRAKALRTPVKIINFGRIYGMGVGKLATTANISEDLARALMRAHKKALPGVTKLDNELKTLGLSGGSIKTFGGRRYFSEEPRWIETNRFTGEGKWQRYEYKLLNYLIQGSAADMLKMAMIEAFRRGLDTPFTVHDEGSVRAPITEIKDAYRELGECMEGVGDLLDVKFFTDGGISAESWGAIEK